LDSRPIEPFVSSECNVLPMKTSQQMVKDKLLANQHNVAHIVDDKSSYQGQVHLVKLISLELSSNKSLERMLASDNLISEEPVFDKQDTVWHAMDQLETHDFVGESIPVVSSNADNRFLGVVFETSLVKIYMEKLRCVREEEHAPA